MSDTHSTAIQLIPLHHQMELLVNLVVLRLRPRSQIEVRLVVAVVSERRVHPPLTLLLTQSLENINKCESSGLELLFWVELLHHKND